MHLYHLLPKRRLEEKLAYAHTHGGRLLLTAHEASKDSAAGALGAYLHLLPDLVGGIEFSAREELAALRVTVDPAAPVARLRGSRTSLDLASAARGAPLIQVRWEEPGLCFQEWLLTDPAAVVEWTADPAVLAQDHQRQLADLDAGRVGPDAFFYPDVDPRAQRAMARLLGHRLGFLQVDDPAALRRAHREALFHIGVEAVTATKCLFFVGPPFLELARRLATDIWDATRPLVGVTGEAPWDDLDDALTRAAEGLLASCPDGAGPLEVRLLDVRRQARPRARFALGWRAGGPAHARTGLASLPAPRAAAERLHTGRLWSVQAVVADLAGAADALGSVGYVLHAFEGARSEANRVRVVVQRAG